MSPIRHPLAHSRARHRWSLLAAPAIAALALGLTACDPAEAGGDGDDGTASASGETTASSDASSSQDSGEDLTWEDSPLGKEFEGISALNAMTEEEQQQQFAEQTRRVEDLVAECMAKEGFDYQPNTASADALIAQSQGDLSELEYAEQYGYGINTSPEPTGEATPSDPNAEAYAQMSEAEQAAWDQALYGEAAEFDEDAAASTEWDWQSQGCYGEAQYQVLQVESEDGAILAVAQQPQFAELLLGLNGLYMNLGQAPEVVALDEEWSECMAEAGYPDLATPTDAVSAVSTSTETDPAVLRENEIAIATADVTCRDELDYNNRTLRVQFAAEEEFITEHRDDIDAFLAAIDEARGSSE